MVNLAELPGAVDAVLDEFFQATSGNLTSIYPTVGQAGEVLRDFVMVGGKRVRPLFVFVGYECAAPVNSDPRHNKITVSESRGDEAEVLRICAAIELIQACALVHDDILDRSDTRRQQPTVHRRFESLHRSRQWAADAAHYGNSAAILLGDLALAWADDLFHGAGPYPSIAPTRPVPFAATSVWSQMRTEVLAGQFLDITNEVSGDESLTAAEQVMRYKTAAYTVARPLELGATLGGGDADLRARLHAIGIDLGIAFQLRDDLLGVFGDPAETGKPSGDDLIAGKRTALLAVGLNAAGSADAARLRTSIGRALDADEIAAARDILVTSGAVNEIERQIADRRDAGLAAIADLTIPDTARTDLVTMAHRVARRTS